MRRARPLVECGSHRGLRIDEMSFGGAASLECGIPGDPNILLPRCVEFLRHAIGS